MTFLQVEGETLVNLELVDKIEVTHRHRVATLRASGIPQVSDSAIAYTFLQQHPEYVVKHATVSCDRCGASCNTLQDLDNHQKNCTQQKEG